MTTFFKILSIMIFIGAIVIPIVINYKRSKDAVGYDGTYNKVKKRYAIIGVIVAIVLFTISCAIVIIPTGYTGVRSTFGQIDPIPVKNGFNWKLPYVQSVEHVNNKQQDIIFKDRVWSETEQRTAIYYENITITYQINPEKSAWIYANVANYKDALINQSIVASSIKSSSKSLSDTDATNRSIIEPLVMKILQKSLDDKYGENVVYINKVIVNNADFEDSYNKAIAAKQQAKLEAEKQEIENQKAIDKATAEAEVKKTNAKAAAEAKLISAQAESKANKILEESLTDKILQEKYINKWNGNLPSTVVGEDAGIMIPSVGK